MEEDIKILKHIAIAYKDDEKVNNSLVNISTSTLITNGELAQAIENILNRLEQDERVIEEMAEWINDLGCIDLDIDKDIIDHFRKVCE